MLKLLKIIPWPLWLVGTGAGLIWLVNLPYPMIRKPVAGVAPILLLPSYISMDRNYREAILNTQQAEQLVNKATSIADIDLGKEKVRSAQQNLDALPVWFLGYEPQFYCSYFGCSWHFTFDEFSQARASVATMEAKIFQERNAFDQLQKAEILVTQSQQQYQNAKNDIQRQQALQQWQKGVDMMAQIPPDTTVAKIANSKLEAYERDFSKLSGLVVQERHTSTLIAAAKEMAKVAMSSCNKTSDTSEEYEQCEDLWEEGIDRLQQIPPHDPGYLEAQTILADYLKNFGDIRRKLAIETRAVVALEEANNQIENLLAQADSLKVSQVRAQLQSIITILQKIPPNTTSYEEAQSLIASAQNKMQQLR